jgi:hypothetical protein
MAAMRACSSSLLMPLPPPPAAAVAPVVSMIQLFLGGEVGKSGAEATEPARREGVDWPMGCACYMDLENIVGPSTGNLGASFFFGKQLLVFNYSKWYKGAYDVL